MASLSSLESDRPQPLPPRMTDQYSRRLAFALLCWGSVVLLEGSQVFVSDVSNGIALPSVHYLAWAVFNWYVLALLTPMIYELGRRYPITGPERLTHIALPHAAACVACLVVQALGRGTAGWVYTLHHELPALPGALAVEWVERRGMVGFIAYWIIVVIAGFAQLREEVRLRELHQAKLETRLASAELEKMRMQIQPHFLFNTLQAAITLIPEDPPAAEDVLLRLSELLRISFDQMDVNEIPLARELNFLDLYVGIQRRRFGDRLSVEIKADPPVLNLLVPPLILQPLVENAVRHGIGKHKGEDCIEIFARLQDRGLQLEVWNSNSVVDETGEQLFHRGVGLRNTRARLQHLYGPGASLIFRSIARGGAAAIIFIPARMNSRTELYSAAGTLR